MLLLITPSFLYVLSHDILILFLSQWVDIRSLANLVVAVSNNASRPYWMTLLHSLQGAIIDDWGHSISSLMWLSRRRIHATRVQMKVDAWRVRGCDLLSLETDDIVQLGLNGCCNLTDRCIMNLVNRCSKLNSIELNTCKKTSRCKLISVGSRMWSAAKHHFCWM